MHSKFHVLEKVRLTHETFDLNHNIQFSISSFRYSFYLFFNIVVTKYNSENSFNIYSSLFPLAKHCSTRMDQANEVKNEITCNFRVVRYDKDCAVLRKRKRRKVNRDRGQKETCKSCVYRDEAVMLNRPKINCGPAAV